MQDRRTFIKNAALVAATAPYIQPDQFLAPVPKHISVQLWSVRDDMQKDAKATIAAIAKMGYREVEPFGFSTDKLHGMGHDDFAKLLKDNGLSMPTTHCGLSPKSYDQSKKDITDEAKKIIDLGAKHGLKYMMVPYLLEDERKDIELLVKMLEAAGKYGKKAGVRIGYHNHDFEYTMTGPDGRKLIEWILHETDPAHIAMQMDIYWVSFAKYNPLDWFKAYPGRWELCHAKDMANSEKRETIEVGDGTIDFKSIFKKSAQAGLKHYVVELENYKTTPMQGIERARTNLLKQF